MLLVFFSTFVIAVDPPRLESQQFHGTAKWAAPAVYTVV